MFWMSRCRPMRGWEAGPQKAVHGGADFPQARRVRDADHTPVPEQPQRCISLVGPRPHRSCAPPVLPARGPQVQQLHQIGFGGFLRGVSAGQIFFGFRTRSGRVRPDGPRQPAVLPPNHASARLGFRSAHDFGGTFPRFGSRFLWPGRAVWIGV